MDEFESEGPAEATGRSESERAIDLAYKTLARRERTVGELRAYLERRGVGPDAVEAAEKELTASGFLDDARYALRFAEDKRELERWGSERIARQLGRRGVAAEFIEAALCDRGHEAELESAVALLGERFPTPPGDDRERNRAWQLLVRRGYAPELAYEAVRAAGRGGRAA
jgi:regulatory protein